MPLELLESIREAERKADAIRAAAQRESRDIIKSVEEVVAVQERSAARELLQMARGIVAENTAQAEREIAAKAGQRNAARETLRTEASGRVLEAANLIVERILAHGDR